MRKYIALALLIFTLLPVLAATPAAAADIYARTDVPKIFITTQTNVTRDYCAAAVRVIDKKGGTEPELSDTGAKVKIRGNSTSSGAKKPFNIKFSSKTDLLGMGKNKKWCLLANCYEKTLLRNQTVLDFSAAIGLAYTPKYRVCDVYLNEKFLGSYLVTDAIGASKTRVDIDTDANEFILERDSYTDEGTTYFTTDIYGIRFGINEPDEQTAEQKAWLFDFVAKANARLPAAASKKSKSISMWIPWWISISCSNISKTLMSARAAPAFILKTAGYTAAPCGISTFQPGTAALIITGITTMSAPPATAGRGCGASVCGFDRCFPCPPCAKSLPRVTPNCRMRS